MSREILNKYRDITNQILEYDDVETIYELIQQREVLINILKSNCAEKVGVAEIIKEFKIVELDKAVGVKLDFIRKEIKDEIDKLHRAKYANNQYESNKNIRNLFSTKI